MSISPIDSIDTTATETASAWELAVRKSVLSLRYGSVEIVVHDGRVVQVETREKVRFFEGLPDHRRPRHEDGRPDRTAGGAASSTREESE
jgi:hypothetical protein